MLMRNRCLYAGLALVTATIATGAVQGARPTPSEGNSARGERAMRSIVIDTREGTWMSVDVAPDGERLVFDLLGDIYAVAPGEPRTQRLTRARVEGELEARGSAYDGQPRISPDGSRVLFLRSELDWADNERDRRIWAVEADGTNPRPFTGEEGDGDPRWSPDGTQLAFASDRGAESPSEINVFIAEWVE